MHGVFGSRRVPVGVTLILYNGKVIITLRMPVHGYHVNFMNSFNIIYNGEYLQCSQL